ncbi:MAG: Holliday junction branch migration protein RuvA [Chlamydiia bacterium]|nr:Holliday junction branch migration protein RuvA [Chlamydiia bacterium]
MYEFLRGKIFGVRKGFLIMDCNNIGYVVYMPKNRLDEAKNAVGSNSMLYTSVIIRDNEFSIYGFLHDIERDIFDACIKIKGVGPKIALNISGSISVEKMNIAVLENQYTTFSSLSGIGEQTAKRLVLELSPFFKSNIKIKDSSSHGELTIEDEKISKAIKALVCLGYDKTTAKKSVSSVALRNRDTNISISDLVKLCVQSMH